ncbi:XRE family transcriptional regulator [Salmonella enterica subsp. enterica serovar Muenchen]|nr:XRE family transcriptional regulator [Salmonella enterica subsp. enterica serovar Muenchen]ECR4176469.1 helix-turn-helix transcriptional regulator [Salmonella enterica]EFU9020145.1 helix-turn-helix transcriptional regulator [Salmonella enterica]
MSSDRGKKLKAIREAEGFSQSEFAALTGINIGVIKNYEYGRQNPGISVIDRILETNDFEKYTLWLMNDKTNELAGQISPSLSPDGQERTSPSQTSRKTGTRHG